MGVTVDVNEGSNSNNNININMMMMMDDDHQGSSHHTTSIETTPSAAVDMCMTPIIITSSNRRSISSSSMNQNNDTTTTTTTTTKRRSWSFTSPILGNGGGSSSGGELTYHNYRRPPPRRLDISTTTSNNNDYESNNQNKITTTGTTTAITTSDASSSNHHHHHHDDENHGHGHRLQQQHPSSDRRKSINSRISILIISVLLFATILSTGFVLIHIVSQSYSKSIRVDVQRLAVETGQFFANELDKATLPLFSMAQFATELDLFNNLPPQIGLTDTPFALPFLNSSTTSPPGQKKRNTTGVCDTPELVSKFNSIAQAATNNAKLGDVLHAIQFAPYGVICLSSPLIYIDPIDGTILNNTNAIGIDLLNTPDQQFIARETIKGETISITGPRTLVQCPDCGIYFIVRIPVISMIHRMMIDNIEYKRWGFATALIQWEKLIQRSAIYDTFASQDKDFRLTRTDRIYNETTQIYDEIVVTLAQSQNYIHGVRNEIEHNLQTTNNEWKIVIQYNDTQMWRGWSMAICTFVAISISFLTYVTLVQRRNQALLKSETLVQEAKVDIERNMTAYFAHELRNPLCAIDCALQAMPDNIPNDAKELILGMRLCSTFMSSIMNNLLDVRKMEEGKLVMRNEPFSLSKLIANIHAMTLPTMKQNVALIQNANTNHRDWVLGDIHRLEQVMYNLVSNSIKYTRVGSVTIYAAWDDTTGSVRLECRDTGPGIPKEEQANLFERFTQRGGAPGSGLGLAIAKNLVTLMGGTIWFDSDPTQRPGTNCIVSIPLQQCDPPIINDEQSKELLLIDDPIRILIVDDITMNRTMLRRRFEKCVAPKCTIQEATTGEEALMICERVDPSFDVIIMDHYMNEAGGVMVGTDAIIALRRMNVQSFIIGCSGNDLDERFYSAGADMIWKKPLPSNVEIIQQFRTALETRRITTSTKDPKLYSAEESTC